MFTSGLTTQLNPHQQKYSFAEKRLTFNTLEKLKIAGAQAKEKGAVAWKVGKVVTFPARVAFWPITKGASMAIKGGAWTWDKARPAGFTAKEAVLGAKDTVVNPLVDLVGASYRNVAMTLGHFPMAIARNTFRLPFEILKTPKNIVNGVRKSVSELFWAPEKLYQSAKTLKPQNVIKTIRQSAQEILAAPLREPLRPYYEMTRDTLSPAYRAKTQYGTSVKNSVRSTRNGINRITHSPQTGKAEAMSVRAEIAAKKKAMKERIEAAKKTKQAAAQKPQAAAA